MQRHQESHGADVWLVVEGNLDLFAFVESHRHTGILGLVDF